MNQDQIIFYVARHGTTVLNESGCFRGSANPPLDEKGFQDARGLAELFTSYPVGEIYSSDKLRATQTANIIADRLGKPFVSVSDLRALNVGDFSSQKKDTEIMDDFMQYIRNPDMQIPGGESLTEFRQRIHPLFYEAIQKYQKTGEPCILVAHSSIVHEVGNFFNGDHLSTLVEPGGVATAYFNEARGFYATAMFRPRDKNKERVDY